MIVYGFSDAAVTQGALIEAAEIQSIEIAASHLETLRQNLGWEVIDTNFVLVKHELIRRMEAEEVSEYEIETVRSMKARDIPVLTAIS
jgi:hypothetical protein